MNFVTLTEVGTGMIGINASLVFGVKPFPKENYPEGRDLNWTNLFIVGERYPQNLITVEESFEEVLAAFRGFLM